MVLSISTNTSAINVQRNLSKANEEAASSLAKLSSGSRVPTSKDDAASLAIGSRVEAEIAGLQQASVNASQATSLLQIADGAYGEINDILIRQESLAIQSASGQLSDTERAIIDSEFQELNSEIDRIALDTEFNGNQLLNGGSTVVATNEVVNGGLAADGLSVAYDSNSVTDGDSFAVTYDSAAQSLTLTNATTGEKISKDIATVMASATGDATTATDLAAGQELEVSFADAGITLTLTDDFDRSSDIGGNITGTGTTNLGTELTEVTYGNGDLAELAASTDFDAATGTLTLTSDASQVLTANGLTIAVNGTDGAAVAADSLVEIKDSSDNVLASFQTGTTGYVDPSDTNTITLEFASVFTNSQTTSSNADFSFKVGTGTSAQDDISISVASVTTTALGTNSTSVDTQANAETAIDSVKAAIDTLQGSRANVGASLSRLDFASSNLAVSIENQSAAKSGLLDVDVAQETTNYAAQQVVVQAGVSLLAQANQQPSQLLSLIG